MAIIDVVKYQTVDGGKVEDIADVATFLASDMSSYVTGQDIQVDGGMNM